MRAAIRRNPTHVAAFSNRGNANAGKGEHDKAISDYTETIRLEPTYVDTYYNRGNTYAIKDEYEKAIGI